MSNWHILLSRLDLTDTRLAEVKKAADTGDISRAQETLIRHFRQRQTPCYFFSEDEMDRFHDPGVVTEADQVCEHFIYGYDLGQQIDWSANPTDDTIKDREWLLSLFRHNFWQSLGRAYRITRDEKYAREFVAQVKSFMARWTPEPYKRGETKKLIFSFPNFPWRPIDTAIRAYTVWLPLFYCFRASPSWDAEGWVCFLNGLHAHGEILRAHYTDHLACSNSCAMESSALFQLGVMFPEFQQAKEWKEMGYRRLAHEVRYQFDQDGVHVERTPVYHLVAANAFLQAYRLAAANNMPVPPYMFPVLERSAEFLLKLMKPDLSLPMVGDADRNSLADRKADSAAYEGMNLTFDPQDLNEIRSFFRTMAKLTGRRDFLYLASCRKEGTPPPERSAALRESGFYVFRTGWEDRDSYFMVTGTQVERGLLTCHSHPDAGHLELQIEGEDVLIDSGRYLYPPLYSCDTEDWKYFRSSTRAHNTVEVDSLPIGHVPDDDCDASSYCASTQRSRTFCHHFQSTPEVDLVDVSHNGYSRLTSPVFHRRRVIFFKPGIWLVDDCLTGWGRHRFDLHFHFAPGQLELQQDPTPSARFHGKRMVVKIVPLLTAGLTAQTVIGTESPFQGWISYGYGVKVPAPVLTYTKEGPVPARFITAIIQSGKGSVAPGKLSTETEAEFIIQVGGRDWRVQLALDEWRIETNGNFFFKQV